MRRGYSSGDLFPALGSCGSDRELQLKWNLRVLFPPQGKERSGQPAPVPAKFVDNRMAGGTKGDQRGGGMAAGTAVMDGALIRRSAALTAVAVAGEDGVTMSAEPPARVGNLPVAASAQSSDGRIGPTAAKQGGLDRFQQRTV